MQQLQTFQPLATFRRSLRPAWVKPGSIADLDFANDRYWSGPSYRPTLADVDGWSFTRSGTRFSDTAAGALTSFGPNVPRITDKGLAVHAGATNLLLRSQEFDNAAWTGLGISVTADQASAPDGTTSMDRVTATLAGGFLRNNAAVTVTPGATYNFSFWSRNQTSTCAYLVYDVSNAADIVTAAYTTTGTQRQSVSFTAPAGCSLVYVYPVYQLPLDESVDIWGAQLETGSVATPHIPTAGSTGSAGVDTAPSDVGLSGGLWTNLGNLDPSNGFWIYAEYVPGGTTSSQNIGVSITGATTSERIRLGKKAGGGTDEEAAFYVQDTGDQAWLRHGAGTASVGATVKQAVRVAANDFASCVGGGTVLTDTSGTVPTLSTIGIGSLIASDPLDGYIRRLVIGEGTLTNAQLQALTS